MAEAIDIQTLVARFEANTRNAEKAFLKYASSAERAAYKAEQGFRKSNRQIARSTERMAGDVRRVIAGIAVAYATREVVQLADAWTEASNKIAAATSISGVQARSLQELADAAVKARGEFTSYVDLYARILRVAPQVAASEREIARATELVAKAFSAGGASTQEQTAGIIQLGQALGGVLQGDELRSVRENAPIIFNAIREEVGATVQDMKKLGAEGKLTGDIVLRAILNAGDGIDEAFGKTVPTISQSMSILNTRIGEYIYEQNSATGASALFSDAILFVADNVETFAEALVVAGVALGGAGVGGAVAAGIPLLKNLGATTTATARALVILRAATAGFGGPVVVGSALAAGAIAYLILQASKAETAFERANRVLEEGNSLLDETQRYADLAPLEEIGRQAGEAIEPVRLFADGLGGVAREMREVADALADATVARFVDDVLRVRGQIEATSEALAEVRRDQAELALQESVGGIPDRRVARDVGATAGELRQQAGALEAQLAGYERRLVGMSAAIGAEGTQGIIAALSSGDVSGAIDALRERLIRTVGEEKGGGRRGLAPDTDDTALKEAEKAVEALREAFVELGQTEEDAIEATYAARIAAIGRVAKTEAERAALVAEADALRLNALNEISAEEAEAAARRKADAVDQVATERELLAELQDLRDEALGRSLAVMEREFEARRANAEAEIEDKKRLVAALAAIDEAEAAARKEFARNALGIGEDGDSVENEIARIEAREAEKLAALEEAAQRELILKEQYAQRRAEIEIEADKEIAAARANAIASQVQDSQTLFANLATIAKGAVGEQSGIYRALYAASKAFAVADAGIKIATAMAQVMADPTAVTLQQKIAAAGVIAAQGAAIMAQLTQSPGFMSGGYTGDGPSNEVAGLVHRGELVFDRRAVQRLGRENLEALRTGRGIVGPRGGAGGAGVQVSINNYAPGVEVVQRSGGAGGPVFDVVQAGAAVASGGNAFTDNLEQKYGLQRRGA